MPNKLRIAVAGLGAVVDEIYERLYYVSPYSERLEIVTIADPSKKRLKSFGEKHNIPENMRFSGYEEMLENASDQFDAVSANLPDNLHMNVSIQSLAKGKYVMVPKPLATKVEEAHIMFSVLPNFRPNGVFFETDFHKRQDKVFQQLKASYESGKYGRFISCELYMLDALKVAMPGFFADPQFAVKNSPLSFLTVHMADALMYVINQRPVEIIADAHIGVLESKHKKLKGALDIVDTTIYFEDGKARISTGWIYPDSAPALTVQGGRFTCSDGLVELDLSRRGYGEYLPRGYTEINTGFKFQSPDGLWGGYGIESPGKIFDHFLAHMNGQISAEQRAALITPIALGFYSTAVIEAAQESLDQGEKRGNMIKGKPVIVNEFLKKKIGPESSEPYLV